MEPAKIMAAQPMCEQISQQRTEPGGSPYSEQLHKHSRRVSGAANTMGIGTGGKPAPNSNEMVISACGAEDGPDAGVSLPPLQEVEERAVGIVESS